MSTTATSPAAARQGALWGERAADWAATEERQRPTYEEALRRVGIDAGAQVLEVGCGSGVFLRMVADRGAQAVGIDASPELVGIARERVPEAGVLVGDFERLPFPDDAFDLVAGFNAFLFAEDMVAALREAGRVARPGAPVVVQVWGAPWRCDLSALVHALGRLRPAREAAPPRLYDPGVLEAIVTEAGLLPDRVFDHEWAYTFEDDDALLRAMLSPSAAVEAIHAAGEDSVRAAVLEALAPYRERDGRYRISNEWRHLVARA